LFLVSGDADALIADAFACLSPAALVEQMRVVALSSLFSSSTMALLLLLVIHGFFLRRLRLLTTFLRH
jgi:hypothetical protein